MIRRLVVMPLITLMLAGVFYACSAGSSQAMCAGADPLYQVANLVSKPPPAGPAPSNNGARTTTKPPPAGTAPSNNGARTGTPPPTAGGAPANNGARPQTPITNPPLPGGRVPSFSGSSVGRNYSSNGHTYIVIYHPRSYWDSYPLDPDNPADPRNYDNIFSPFYHEHIRIPCH